MEGLEGLELDSGTLEKVQAAVQLNVDNQVKGLKEKNSELLGKVKTTGETLSNLQSQVEKFSVLGDLDPAMVRQTFDSFEEGKIQEAMKAAGVNADQLKPILGPQLEKAKKEWEAETNKTVNALTAERDELSKTATSLTERVKVMQLDEVARGVFNNLPDSQKGADAVIAEQVRKVFSLDADGKSVALDEDGEIILDSKKQPLTIETYINENLREAMPFLFVEPQGGGGKGGRGSAGNGFGTGITSRKDNSPATMAKFLDAAEAAGKTAEEATAAWAALPAE